MTGPTVMILTKWLEAILHPQEMQFKEVSIEKIRAALRSQTVQEKWIGSLSDKLRAINQEIDHLLEKEDRERIWQALAIERRTILRCLTMISDAAEELESERFAEEARDRFYEKYKGVSAPIAGQ